MLALVAVLCFVILFGIVLWSREIKAVFEKRRQRRDAFHEGRRAFFAGDRINPYRSGKSKVRWNAGYRDAQRLVSRAKSVEKQVK